MSHVPHELTEEFPDQAQTITRLKAEAPHFAKLAERYHVLNREIHRAETNVEPCSDVHMLELRRQRLTLKDEIAAILRDAA
ncbi:YdcH family protein [uncultured Jannaschia sp.]|uniref:YdcH family protein n=1 Tax=uncultured Jannaschia sp. TaxID=293347 RepID=UPI00262DE33F|nr:YdcH family protein [uncultured Jannaschia sp.]